MAVEHARPGRPRRGPRHRRPSPDHRHRPPRGRRARGAGRDRVHAQEHRDAAQRPRGRAELAGAALRGGQQHRRLHRHPRPPLARGPAARPRDGAELDPGVQEVRRGDRAPGPAGHRRRAGDVAHRHDLGSPRPSRLALPPDPAAHLGHRARRGARPGSAAASGLRRRRRRPLLRQGLRAGDRPAHACRHAPLRHVQRLVGPSGRQPRVRHRRQRRGARRRRVAPPGRAPDAPADDPYLDISRLTRDTGFEPAFDVRAGVADYVAWLRENPS